MPSAQDTRSSPTRRPATWCLLALVGLLAVPGSVLGQSLDSRLDHAQSELQQTKDQAGVLTTTVERNADRVSGLRGQIATLRNREAIVLQKLHQAELELKRDRQRLIALRADLQRSLNVLRNRLVEIYRDGQPDVMTVILNSSGFDDLMTRYEYLRRISESDAAIAGRVRGLRDEAEVTVERSQAARQEIAAREAELARTRSELESQEGELAAALDRQRADLAATREREDELSDHVASLQADIQAQLQAAAQTDSAAAPATLPAGPVPDASAAGLIWPVEGVLTSPFGPRWGSFHPGIDIGAPTGTSIRAAKGGVVVNAAYNGGYGNFTCINHGGGLSTCYAHQSSFAISAGNTVEQGDVIGYVGSTGFSTGPHLHFEVRVNGQAVDPMGYL